MFKPVIVTGDIDEVLLVPANGNFGKATFTSGAVPLVNCAKREQISNPVQWILVMNLLY